jgi:tRNA pseudouridine38-40 synthase
MTDGEEPGVTGQQLGNARLLVAYDGTDFRGFAESDGVRTVEGELRGAIERVVRRPVELVLGGRTDAGVHGWGQVVNGQIPVDTDLYRLVSSINQLLRPEISVRDPEWVDDAFSARFSATSRTYRYDIWNDRSPNPLVARRVWHVGPAVDLESMNAAADLVLGTHDFSSFCRKPKPGPGYDEPSMKRVLQNARWHRPDASALVRFEITASSFCHQMVRSIVGTLVDVGFGRIDVAAIPEILAARDRNAAGQVAPPTGLTLWHIGFDGVRWDA